MYAAAGGASLASRQARQRQRQQNTKNRELQQKKLAQIKAGANDITAPSKAPTQSKQFHQLPTNYLRTPNAQARKLSAGYTTQSKLLLPIDESNSNQNHQQIPPSPSRHHISQHHHYDELRRQHLRKSATASLPLVSQAEPTPPSTPTQCFGHLKPHSIDHGDDTLHPSIHIQIPHPQDPIIVTPATPLASPHQLNAGQLERKCSVYRGRELNKQLEESNNKTTTITATTVHDLQVTDEFNYGIPNGGQTTQKHWTDVADYYDSEHRQMGICTCDQIEVIC